MGEGEHKEEAYTNLDTSTQPSRKEPINEPHCDEDWVETDDVRENGIVIIG